MSALDDLINGELGATPLVIREHIEALVEKAIRDASAAAHDLERVLPPEAVTLLPMIHVLAVKTTLLDVKVMLLAATTGGPFSRVAHQEAIAYVNQRMASVNEMVTQEWNTE